MRWIVGQDSCPPRPYHLQLIPLPQFDDAAEFNKRLAAVHRNRSLSFSEFSHSRYSVAHPLTGCLPSDGDLPAGCHSNGYVHWYPHYPQEG
jgi:hypothetical protein